MWVLREIKYLTKKKKKIKEKKIEEKKGKTSSLWINKCLNHVNFILNYIELKRIGSDHSCELLAGFYVCSPILKVCLIIQKI